MCEGAGRRWGAQTAKGSAVGPSSHPEAQEGAGPLPSWTAKALTALLLQEFSGNREPPGAGEGLDQNPGKGHS